MPCDPPLGAEVYDRLAEYAPSKWGPGSQPGRYSVGLRQDFEGTMFHEVCRWHPSLSILEWQRPMALYFAQFKPDDTGEDLYSRLLTHLRDTGKIGAVSFGSLNYDYLFERAASRLGFNVEYLSDEVGETSIPVLKIHGSCNFITEGMERWRPYLTSTGSHTECKMEVAAPTEELADILERKFADNGAARFPVMSLYSLGKGSLVNGVKIHAIRNRWAQQVRDAKWVVIIGVSPNPHDTHVWDPVGESTARILYIGSAADGHRWAELNNNVTLLAETFAEGWSPLLEALQATK